jgi:DNA-binding SARP family transcriptional activator
LLESQPIPTDTKPNPTSVPPGGREPADRATSTDAVPAHTPPPRDAQPATNKQAGEPAPVRSLALRVLGRVELALDDGDERELGGALTPKQREVLVYLALHPQGARREALNDAIWPEARPPRPFNSLHNALSLLRRALTQATDGMITDVVRNDDGRYQLDRDLVTTDFERFQAALQAPRTGSGDDALVPLNEAIQLYRGDLAEDLTAAWIEPFRESIRRDALDALSALIRRHGDTEPETALALLEHARKLDRYNESIYRDIIRTQARLGQYDAIPRTLALLANTLNEIGHQPTSDTFNLGEFLQRQGKHRSSTDNAAAS